MHSPSRKSKTKPSNLPIVYIHIFLPRFFCSANRWRLYRNVIVFCKSKNRWTSWGRRNSNSWQHWTSPPRTMQQQKLRTRCCARRWWSWRADSARCARSYATWTQTMLLMLQQQWMPIQQLSWAELLATILLAQAQLHGTLACKWSSSL